MVNDSFGFHLLEAHSKGKGENVGECAQRTASIFWLCSHTRKRAFQTLLPGCLTFRRRAIVLDELGPCLEQVLLCMPLNVCRTRNIVGFQGTLRCLGDRPETWVVQVEKIAPFLEMVQFLASFGSPNTLCFAGRLKSFSDQWMELIMTSSFCDTIYFQVQPSSLSWLYSFYLSPQRCKNTVYLRVGSHCAG